MSESLITSTGVAQGGHGVTPHRDGELREIGSQVFPPQVARSASGLFQCVGLRP